MSNHIPKSNLVNFISRTWPVFLGIFIIVIIMGVGFIILQNINNNVELAGIEQLEQTDEQYNNIFSEYPLNELHDNLPSEDIQKLIDTLLEIPLQHANTYSAQESYYRVGRLYVLLGNYEEAQFYFTEALSLKKKSHLQPKILSNVAAVAEELNDIELAKEYLSRIRYDYADSIETAHAIFSLGRLSEMTDIQEGTNTAQGVYLSLLNDDKWKESPWTSLAKSRLAYLGYVNDNEVQ